MSKPLAGIKVVEVAMWAFVPVTGAMLADLGASVLKIEAHEGDPMRALTTGGSSHSWELYNRGKRSIALDLKAEGAVEVLHKLLEDADVFLTSLLPAARRRLGIDVDDIRARHPNIVYAAGSALGPQGPEMEKGGYDFITFWCRGGVAAGVTPDSEPYPLTMPSGAFGDCTSGSMLAGGICAALLQRERTGKAPVVDVSLLSASMWVMQRNITAASAAGIGDLPKKDRRVGLNPLVQTYRTGDDRFLALCMIQSDRWWDGFCAALDEPKLRDDPRFASHDDRATNYLACVELLDEIFAGKPLADWRRILGSQPGPWDVVQLAGEMKDDVQVQANNYLQDVDCGGHTLKMVAVPVQFDRQSMAPQAAPDVGAHSDEILAEAGYSEEQILDLKVGGLVW